MTDLVRVAVAGDVTEAEEERLVAPGEFADPERISQDKELKRLVADAVEGLPSRERIVVGLYQIVGNEFPSLAEIEIEVGDQR